MFRKLQVNDYYRGYLELLSGLTICNFKNITYDMFKKRYDEINSNIYVLEIDNKIIATGSIFIEKKFIRDMKNVGHIEDIIIDEKYRGKGIGKDIIFYLINIAKNNECYKVILDCSDENIKFYEKCGFNKKENHMAMYM